jgi:hypothetical protein
MNEIIMALMKWLKKLFKKLTMAKLAMVIKLTMSKIKLARLTINKVNTV